MKIKQLKINNFIGIKGDIESGLSTISEDLRRQL